MTDKKVISKKLSKYFDFVYFLKFVVLLTTLYYFNIFYIAVTDHQGKLYSSFLDHNLNYINWLRNSILYFSNVITHLFGVDSYIQLPYRLKIPHGPSVETVYACLGLGLMSFWIAFVVCYTGSWMKKIVWSIAGIFCIWLINCLRVALLLIALQQGKEVNAYLDHHTVFNIVAYSLIGVMIIFFTKSINRPGKGFDLQLS